MISGIQSSSGLQNLSGWRALQAWQGLENKGGIKEEFLTIFYKELLKEAFKPFAPEENNFSQIFATDLLRERLALELARSRSFSLENLFPTISTTEVK